MANKTDPTIRGRAVNKSNLEIIREGDFRPKNETTENENQENFKQQLERLQFNQSQERLVFQQKNFNEEQKVKDLINQIKQLSKSVKVLDNQIEKTIEQTPVNLGSYHLNFFQKIKEMLILAKKNVDQATVWLETFNKRKNKKNYWSQFKKSGTQWSLSNERYVATSVG